ncbi:UxaA family hydrolase [Halococcus agarilyticus]|uniref:UxaA family hydrolase n=1 Tax=Halococcus agarilyticus TaxID=1232219 RepID=UPI000677BEF6|nr:UxaA family hydrolase [Halococcus agarilyticus]
MKGIVLDDDGLLLSENDNVATAISDLDEARTVALDDHPRPATVGDTIDLSEGIPFGHKFATEPVKEGEPVLKYGEKIGVATDDIDTGDWVHTHNCESTRGRGDLSRTHERTSTATEVER